MPKKHKVEEDVYTVANAKAAAGRKKITDSKGAKKKGGESLLEIEIPAIQVNTMVLTIVGDSGLICNKWSEKAVKELLDTYMGKAHKKKEAKNPKQEFLASLYVLPNGQYGFPGIAFKLAAVEACRFVDGIAMTKAYGAFHVNDEFVIIKSKNKPVMRQDMVRIGSKGPGTGSPDVRFRGEFKDWSADITIRYNASVINASQIANLFNIAGFSIGIGEWRPTRRGMHGLFHVKVG